MKAILLVLSFAIFSACVKESRTKYTLKSGSGKWQIVDSEWEAISTMTGVLKDTSGTSPIPGYFQFDGKQTGVFYCDYSNILVYDFSTSFEWDADKGSIELEGYSTEPKDMTFQPLFWESWMSFSGDLSEDKKYLILEGYFKREWVGMGYNVFFVRFGLEKE